MTPPGEQPPAKVYLDSNAGWPEQSWEMSEPAIYYQACYIRLLVDFVKPGKMSDSKDVASPDSP